MEKNIIIRRGADLRVFEFLKDLQNNLYDSNLIVINQMAKKHKIGMCYGLTLIDLKIIKKLGCKKYLWLAGNPSLLMARKILKHYRENNRNIIENEQVSINFTQPVKNKVEINLEERYTNYLNELYKNFENNEYVDLYSATLKYKNGTQFSAILQHLKIIKKIEQKKFIWIGRKPSKQMVIKLIQESRLYNSLAVNKYLDINKPITNIPKPRTINVYPEKIKQKNSSLSFTLFWGLIKIQKT